MKKYYLLIHYSGDQVVRYYTEDPETLLPRLLAAGYLYLGMVNKDVYLSFSYRETATWNRPLELI